MDTVSSPKDRLISSKEHELREIRNKLTATMKQLQEIERENKTLRRLQVNVNCCCCCCCYYYYYCYSIDTTRERITQG